MKQLRKQADEFVFMTTTIGPRAILVFLVIVVGLLRMCIPVRLIQWTTVSTNLPR